MSKPKSGNVREPLLTREQILSAPRKTEVVEVPEWGGSVRVRELLGTDFETFEELRSSGSYVQALAHVAQCCIVDDEGNRLFGPEDTPQLAAQPMGALVRVADAVQRLSNITPEGIEIARKNLHNSPGAGSSTD